VNARAVERLNVLLKPVGHARREYYGGCTCDRDARIAEAIVAAGWGHPDDLTDEQVRYLTAIEEPTVFWNTETDFRAALARANRGES